MIATGTDVKPLECLLFMRDVKSRNYFEQMKGRGTRTFDLDDLKKVTPSAKSAKTHYVIVDAVGVTKSLKTSSQPLITKPTVPFKDLAMGVMLVGELCAITTGDKDVNEGSPSGEFPFFTCAQEISKSNSYSFDGEAILIAGNGNFSVKKYKGKFEAYQRTYVLQNFKISPAYLYYFISHRLSEITKDNRGSTIRYIRIGNLTDYDVAFPCEQAQHRIVAKIEELFSELDKGIENLKTAREQNHDKLEPATALLARIHTEREQRYQQWQANGGSKPKAPKPLPPLTKEELAELPELPEGWGWFKLADLSDISGGLTKNQKRNSLPLKRPFLRVGNVYANRLELDDMHDTGITEAELERVTLVKGDILIVEGNGSVDQIGRVAIWNGSIEGCVHQDHLIKSRPLSLAHAEFLLYFLMSELGRKFIVRAASSTSGLHTLSISKVESLFVPLCASEEQDALLSELASKLSLADQLDQTLTTALLARIRAEKQISNQGSKKSLSRSKRND
jgi:type I restriction enzyme S subunit